MGERSGQTRGCARWLAASGAAALLIAAACGDDDTVFPSDPSGTGAGAAGGSSSSTGGASNPCSTSSECGTDEYNAEVKPTIAYLVVDRSSSMNDDDKWTKATTALAEFFGASSGITVGLGFFPSDSMPCSASSYTSPEVGAMALPSDDHQAELLAALENNDPAATGSTPTQPALLGAYGWIEDDLAADPDQQAVVILVSDGQAAGCGAADNLAAVTGAAANALEDGILTYAVGLEGSDASELEAIAEAGGTGDAFVIGTGNLGDELKAALEAIQFSPVACEFPMPEEVPDDADILVETNVCYTPSGSNTGVIKSVQSSGACGASGWYFKDPDATDKTIVLCPDTCAQIQEDQGAAVQIVVGCQTIF